MTVDPALAMVMTPTDPANWLVVAPTLLTILGGTVCLMSRKHTHLQPKIGISVLSLLVLNNLVLFGRVYSSGTITMVMGNWLPPFGIAFTVDILGATMALIGAVIALCGGIYATTTIDASGRRYGFYPLLLMLMTGVNGAFLTGDIFNLYVWFEVLLISSYGLLVLGNDRPQLDGALKYGVLNLMGTTFFLVATGMLYGLLGTLNMADIAMKLRHVDGSGPIATIATLYLFAFAMKAAAFPLNSWLPASYHTPRIVVSAIFAGLLTKVGVYALLRVMIMLMPGARDALSTVIIIVAILTLLTGALGALAQSDVRRLLGYLVISGIGSVLAGLGIGSELGVSGAIFYALHSIMTMTALYLTAGIMGGYGGSFNLRRLGGLYAVNPLLAAIFLILGFAVSGLPPFSGFWPKVMLVRASLTDGHSLLAAAILLNGFLSTLAVGRVWIYAFWRGGPEGTVDGSLVLPPVVASGLTAIPVWIPVCFLTVLIIAFGVAPSGLMGVTTSGAQGLLDPSTYLQSVFGGAS